MWTSRSQTGDLSAASGLSKRLRVLVVDVPRRARPPLSGMLAGNQRLDLCNVASIDDIVQLVHRTRPDVILIASSVLVVRTASLHEVVLAISPAPKLVVVGIRQDEVPLFVHLPIHGWLDDRIDGEDLAAVVTAVSRGYMCLSDSLGRTVLARSATDAGEWKPSDRDLEILLLLSDGLQDKEIGRRLGISPWTVRSHLTKLFDRLGVRSRLELIVLCYRERLLDRASRGRSSMGQNCDPV